MRPINFGMKSKDFITAARKRKFTVVTEPVANNRMKMHISHPLLKEAWEGLTPSHGEVNGHFVKYVKRCLRQLEQLEQDTKAPPKETPAAPDYAIPVSPDAARLKEEGKKMDEARLTQQAADTLAAWLDDRAKEGLRQFPLATINNKLRAKLSLPDAELTVAALGVLVRRNILGAGKYQRGDRQYRGYRINPALLNGGPSLIEAYDGAWKSLPVAPAFDASLPMEAAPTPQPKPAAKPAPAKAPPAPAQGDFRAALVRDALQDQDMVLTLIDMYIANQQFEKLAQLLIGSTDVEWCEKVLRRVAEIAGMTRSE